MIELLVYEHLCATRSPSGEPRSWLIEGRAMLERVLADLSANRLSLGTCLHPGQSPPSLPNLRVIWMTGDWKTAARSAFAQSKKSLIIAPEPDGVLAMLADLATSAGAEMLGPSASDIKLFSDKRATASLLGCLAIPTSSRIEDFPDAKHIVVKPNDGAGALSTAVGPKEDMARLLDRLRKESPHVDWIVQPWTKGTPASIAVVGDGAGGGRPLPFIFQNIRHSPRAGESPHVEWLQYDGGSLEPSPGLQARAERLARAILCACPTLRGYFGVDLLFGETPDQDLIVEVNPRLTTSYVAYSRLFGDRLGTLLSGNTAALDPSLPTIPTPLRFHPDGSFS